MKHFIWIGSTILTLAMIAAQCGAASSPTAVEETNDQVAQASASEPSAADDEGAEFSGY